MSVSNAVHMMVIDGELVEGEGTIPVVNPATGQVVAFAPRCSRAQLDLAVAAARRAWPGWRATPIAERRQALVHMAAALNDNIDGLGRLLTSEQGKPVEAAVGEVGGAAYWIQGITALDIPTMILEDTDERRVEVQHLPIGVVGAIAPWNFPIMLAIWKVAPALLAGNCMVLKPSPFTPLTTLKMGEIFAKLLPPGVLNVVSGDDTLGPWMTEHSGIDKISFTGSTQTGKRVMASASATLKRLTLELGGNDPAIVLPDVDVEAVAPKLFWSAFMNTGQVCVATKRLYVHDAIYDRLATALVDFARTVKVADGTEQGTQLGPIQNRPQYDRVRELIADSKSNGHSFLLGGTDNPAGRAPYGEGYFVPITIVDNPPEDSRIVREEQFGPVLPMLRFSDIDDVVDRANCSEYGLAASVWSEDLDAATAVAERLEAGTIWINEAQYLTPNIPFGGHKLSGAGVENGVEGLLEFTVSRTIVRKVA